MRLDRSLVAGFFCCMSCGVVYTQIMSRLPAVKAQTGISDADVGLALMFLGCGSLAGFLTVNVILRYMQVKTLLTASVWGFALVCLCLSLVTHRETLFALFALWGYVCSYLDVTMNTHGIFLEHKREKPCLSSLHACYSMGCLVGSGIGSAFAFAGVSLFVNCLIITLLICAVMWLLKGYLLPDPECMADKAAPQPEELQEPGNTKKSGKFFIPWFLLFCGLMGMFSYCAEGSVAEWGSIVLYQVKGASEGVSALAYGSFALFMAICRFGGDHVRARIGDFRIVLAGGIIALCGMCLVLFTDSPALCLTGYVFMGIGLSPVFPVALSNAGRYTRLPAKVSSAIVSFVGYAGLLVIPPAIGFLAQHFGLERALYLPFAAICIVIAGSFVFWYRKRSQRQGATA